MTAWTVVYGLTAWPLAAMVTAALYALVRAKEGPR